MSEQLQAEILTDADRELIAIARETVLQDRLYPDRHRIATAMLTESGEIFTGVCVQAEFVKPAGVCGERIAVGQWATAACTSPVTTIVSVRKPRLSEEDQTIKVAASCGICRDLLTDYFPDAYMIAVGDEGLRKFRLSSLLPLKYRSVSRES